jgi:ankyrin repeat protein
MKLKNKSKIMKRVIIAIFIMVFHVLPVLSQNFPTTCNSSDMQNFFLKAIEQGDTVKMKQYLDLGIDINGTWCEPFKPGGESRRIYYENDWSPSQFHGDLYPIYARTPFIMKAIMTGNENTVRFFVSNSANINQLFIIPRYGDGKNSTGYATYGIPLIGSNRISPLGRYIMDHMYERSSARPGGNIKIITYLIDNGAKLTPDDMKYIYKHIESYEDWPWLCEVLTKAGCSFDFNTNFLYRTLRSHNHSYYMKKNVEKLLSLGVKPDGSCLLAAFTEANDVELAKRFIDMGAPINYYYYKGSTLYNGTTLLGNAVIAKNLNFVKYLVEKGASINVEVTYYDSDAYYNSGNGNRTVKLLEYAKTKRIGDDIIEYLMIAQAKQAQIMQKAEQGDPEALHQIVQMYGGNFSEGLVRIEMNGKCGFIDTTNKKIIPCKYDGAGNFSEGLVYVKLNGKWGFIDKTGKEIIPFKRILVQDNPATQDLRTKILKKVATNNNYKKNINIL